MKKIIMMVVGIVILLSLAPAALAGENQKTTEITVEMRQVHEIVSGSGTNVVVAETATVEVAIIVDKVEYVANAATPDRLKAIRVWKGIDDVLFDLDANGVDYGAAYDNTPPKDKQLSQAAAAKLWATYLEKFEVLRKKLKVIVRQGLLH